MTVQYILLTTVWCCVLIVDKLRTCEEHALLAMRLGVGGLAAGWHFCDSRLYRSCFNFSFSRLRLITTYPDGVVVLKEGSTKVFWLVLLRGNCWASTGTRCHDSKLL